MKKLIYLLTTLIVFSSCGSSKYIAGNTVEDKVLAEALRKLDKKPGDTALQNSLKYLYNDAALAHLNNIERYQKLQNNDRYDKTIAEYQSLQKLSEIIKISSLARKFVTAPSYLNEIQQTKVDAAEDFYEYGLQMSENGADKQSYRDAYAAFLRANGYVPGYKDVKRQINDAFQNSILDVVINPVTDNSSYYQSIGRNRFGNSFNSDMMQRSLVRDLGGDYNKNAPARFYTDIDASRARIDVDWVVDIMWTNLDIPRPFTNTYTKNVSKEIEVGKDTSGKKLYQTVNATLYLTKRYFTAQGDLECRVTDAVTRKNVDLKRYTSRVDWSQEYGTYKGDSRALSEIDWAMINLRNPQLPSREEILAGLFDKMYPQLRSGIQNLVR
ncbi:MAG: hypothetical protein ABI266_04165 [Ginsengibacter sp.]